MKPLDIAATAEASGTPVRKSYNDGPAGVALLGMVSEAEQGIAAKSAGLRQRAPIAGASVFTHQVGFRNIHRGVANTGGFERLMFWISFSRCVDLLPLEPMVQVVR